MQAESVLGLMFIVSSFTNIYTALKWREEVLVLNDRVRNLEESLSSAKTVNDRLHLEKERYRSERDNWRTQAEIL